MANNPTDPLQAAGQQFSWFGVLPEQSLSMDIVNRQNIAALKSIGWAEVEREADADFVFSFFHQERSAPDRSPRTRIFYLCTTTHNSIVSSYVQPYRELAAVDGNLIFVLNAAMQRSFAEAGVPARVWNHGVDLDLFKPGPRPDGPLTFGFMGQNCPFKRTHFLYQAFLNAFGPDNSDARLMIVASPDMARELGGRARNVHFRSRIERGRVPDFYHSLDCFVTFSYAEGYNMTPLEALACGIPCMVTDSPEMHESPYDRECIHVPASRVLRPKTLLGQAFAPSDPSLYFTPPWVHEVSMDDAVDALRAFAADPVPRRAATLSAEFSWRGRIETQVLPFLPEPFGKRGADPAFLRLWRDPRMPVYRARPIRKTNHWSLQAHDGEFLLTPRAGTRGLRCNAVGAAVWRLCDGKNRFVDIVYELQTGVEGAPDNIVEVLDCIVSALLDHGVLRFYDA